MKLNLQTTNKNIKMNTSQLSLTKLESSLSKLTADLPKKKILELATLHCQLMVNQVKDRHFLLDTLRKTGISYKGQIRCPINIRQAEDMLPHITSDLAKEKLLGMAKMYAQMNIDLLNDRTEISRLFPKSGQSKIDALVELLSDD